MASSARSAACRDRGTSRRGLSGDDRAASGLAVRRSPRCANALGDLERRRMTREQLEHVIRAAAAISGDDEIVVVGSQAILGQFPAAPAELCVSIEADVYPKNKPEHSD